MRAAAFALAAWLASAAPALAADAAESQVIGYSLDGRYFAFEQFGIQDGSGFPYSDIFVIDLAENRWVDGTPFRELAEAEGARLGEARRQNATRAAPLLDRLRVSETATTLASSPAFEVSADRRTVTYDRGYQHGGATPAAQKNLFFDRYRLTVAAIDAGPAPDGCTTDFGPVVGLALTLDNLKTGVSAEVYRDASVPASRHCPIAYDIDKVAAPAGWGVPDRPVALIGVYSPGFEGPNRRYIAVPLSRE